MNLLLHSMWNGKIKVITDIRRCGKSVLLFDLFSLMLTKVFFKKIIIRMDVPHNFYDDNGIFHCNLIGLLLDRVELF